jgi:hypothetical protein
MLAPRLAAVLAAALAALPAPAGEPAAAQAPADELTRAVAAYPITLDKVERYARAVKALRAAAERSESLAAALAVPRAEGTTLADEAERLDGLPRLKAVLGKHGLDGTDLLLLPQVLQAGRAALQAEQAGRALPPERVNAAAVRLLREQAARLDQLTRASQDDLAALGLR